MSLNSEVVLDQDAIDVIIHVARNPHGRDLAWKFFRDKWKILNARYILFFVIIIMLLFLCCLHFLYFASAVYFNMYVQ